MTTIRSSALLIALAAALLGTAFSTAFASAQAVPAAAALDSTADELTSAPEWSVFLAP